MANGYLPKLIDHANGDKSDNRITNLRKCTYSQNQRNRNSIGVSIYKGVHWFSRDSKWRASIQIEGKKHFLGSHEVEEDAYKAYLNAAKKFNVIDFIRQ